MNNLSLLTERKPIKASVTRINNEFELSNPYMTSPNKKVIKDYIYYPQKRVIA